mgnify:CR=1 FL=1
MFRNQMLIAAIFFVLFFLSGCHSPVVKREKFDIPNINSSEAEIEKHYERLRQLLLKPNTKEVGDEALEIAEKLKDEKDESDLFHMEMKYETEAVVYAKAAVVAESVSPNKQNKIIYADRAIDAAEKSFPGVAVEYTQRFAFRQKKHEDIVYEAAWRSRGESRRLIMERKNLSHLIFFIQAVCYSIKGNSQSAIYYFNIIKPEEREIYLSEFKSFTIKCDP